MARLILVCLLILGCRRAPSGSGPIVVVDDGRFTTRLSRPAVRVVSLMPASTELVFALGAGSLLVGRTTWCDYPAEAVQVPSVGDGLAPNVEAIVAQRPDLVLSYRSPSNAPAIDRLRGLGIAVLELAIDQFADFERDARMVATALGRAAVGDSLVAATRADLERSTVISQQPVSVLMVAWSDPPMTLGGGSFLSEIVSRAGARNVFDDATRPSFVVSLEAVVDRHPDRILVVGDAEPEFATRPEWQVVPAVRLRHFVRVEGSLFNRPSPRIGAAVRTLTAALAAMPR